MYFVYVLLSQKLSKRYLGSSEDAENSLFEHNRGSNKFTRGGIPWIKIYQEEFQNKAEALKREMFLKSGQGRRWLDIMFPQFRKDAGVV